MATISEALTALNANYTTLNALIANYYSFTDEPNTIPKTYITDGGNDMYDSANVMNTNLTHLYSVVRNNGFSSRLSTSIPYTHTKHTNTSFVYKGDGVVTSGTSYFGSGSQYFTNLYPGFFVMMATGINITEFSITGNIGVDGGGTLATHDFTVTVNGQDYAVYRKSIYNTPDPSINHIIIIPGSGSGVTHTWETGRNYDDDAIQGLTSAVSTIYYICAARRTGTTGTLLSDSDAITFVTEFLEIAGLGSPVTGGGTLGGVAQVQYNAMNLQGIGGSLSQGTSTISLVREEPIATGNILSGGISFNYSDRLISGLGGILIGGESYSYSYNLGSNVAGGGALVGGGAFVQIVTDKVSTAGVLCDSNAFIQKIYPNYDASGGMNIDINARAELLVFIITNGGVTVNGSHQVNVFREIISIANTIASTSAFIQKIYPNYDASGGTGIDLTTTSDVISFITTYGGVTNFGGHSVNCVYAGEAFGGVYGSEKDGESSLVFKYINFISSAGALVNGSNLQLLTFSDIGSGSIIANGEALDSAFITAVLGSRTAVMGGIAGTVEDFLSEGGLNSSGTAHVVMESQNFLCDKGTKMLGVKAKYASRMRRDKRYIAEKGSALVPAITLCNQNIDFRFLSKKSS